MGNYLRLLHDITTPEVRKSEEIAEIWATYDERVRQSKVNDLPPTCLTSYEIASHKARIDALEAVTTLMIKGELIQPFEVSVAAAKNVGIDFNVPRYVKDFNGEKFVDTSVVHFITRDIKELITANQGEQ